MAFIDQVMMNDPNSTNCTANCKDLHLIGQLENELAQAILGIKNNDPGVTSLKLDHVDGLEASPACSTTPGTTSASRSNWVAAHSGLFPLP